MPTLPSRPSAAPAGRLVAAGLALVAALAPGLAGSPAAAVSERARQPELAFAGESALAAGLPYQGTVVGGLSSITYDAARDVYYAISDSEPGLAAAPGPVRVYTLTVDTADGSIGAGDVRVVGVTLLTDAAGRPLAAGTVDPEGLTLTPDDTWIVTSEGFATASPPVPPFVREFTIAGRQLREIDLPAYVDPDGTTTGVRQNLGLESAAVTPDGRHLVTGFENALVQDGLTSTLTTTSPSRLLDIELAGGTVRSEYVYRNGRVAEAPAPATAFTVNGLVELLPFNRRFGLAMERSFSVGAGNTIRLYRYALAGADDVSGVDHLDGAPPVREVGKELVLDLDELGLTLDNIEGMTLGPRLPDGGRALLLVSDNNFATGQVSQFLLFSADGVGPAA